MGSSASSDTPSQQQQQQPLRPPSSLLDDSERAALQEHLRTTTASSSRDAFAALFLKRHLHCSEPVGRALSLLLFAELPVVAAAAEGGSGINLDVADSAILGPVVKGTISQVTKRLHESVIMRADLAHLVLLCFASATPIKDGGDAAIAAVDVAENVDPVISAVKELLPGEEGAKITLAQFRSVLLAEIFPCLYDTLQESLRATYLRFPSSSPKLSLPLLDKESQILSNPFSLFLLCISLGGLWSRISTDGDETDSGEKWTRLFASFEQGISFDQLCVSISGYTGPTLLLIRDTTNAEFGAFTQTGWRESNQYFGGDKDCSLFSLRPTLRLFPKQETGKNCQFLCVRSKNNIIPRGLGFGGDVLNSGSCRLWLDGEMDNCRAAKEDIIFKTGPLRANATSKDRFVPAVVEMWGLGGSEASSARAKEKDAKEAIIMGRRKVDKTQFLNKFDKEVLLTKTFANNDNDKSNDR